MKIFVFQKYLFAHGVVFSSTHRLQLSVSLLLLLKPEGGFGKKTVTINAY